MKCEAHRLFLQRREYRFNRCMAQVFRRRNAMAAARTVDMLALLYKDFVPVCPAFLKALLDVYPHYPPVYT